MPTDLPPWVHQHRQQLGDRIRHLRQTRGLTQETLAEQCGLDRKTINRAEQGHHAVSVDALLLIAHVLEVPTWALFHDGE